VAYSTFLHWSVFRHADVARALDDPRSFSNEVSAHQSVPNGMDPPVHTAYRRIIDPYFSAERMISFDPERDTPAALGEIAATRHIDTSRWTLATADADTVRDIAALLDVQYRRLPSGEFSHSAVITVLSARGEIVARSGKLGRADPALLEHLRH
jgi:cytochrome P450